MGQQNNTLFKSNVTSIKSLNIADGKIDATELTLLLNAIADSTGWEDTKYTMTTNAFDANNGRLQERTLAANGSLTLSNCQPGKYYTIIKKGAFTLSLPTGQYSASGATTGTATTIITFMYDGTNYFFTFSAYSAT